MGPYEKKRERERERERKKIILYNINLPNYYACLSMKICKQTK